MNNTDSSPKFASRTDQLGLAAIAVAAAVAAVVTWGGQDGRSYLIAAVAAAGCSLGLYLAQRQGRYTGATRRQFNVVGLLLAAVLIHEAPFFEGQSSEDFSRVLFAVSAALTAVLLARRIRRAGGGIFPWERLTLVSLSSWLFLSAYVVLFTEGAFLPHVPLIAVMVGLAALASAPTQGLGTAPSAPWPSGSRTTPTGKAIACEHRD